MFTSQTLNAVSVVHLHGDSAKRDSELFERRRGPAGLVVFKNGSRSGYVKRGTRSLTNICTDRGALQCRMCKTGKYIM